MGYSYGKSYIYIIEGRGLFKLDIIKFMQILYQSVYACTVLCNCNRSMHEASDYFLRELKDL